MLLEDIWSAMLESEFSYISGRFAQQTHVTDKSLKMEGSLVKWDSSHFWCIDFDLLIPHKNKNNLSQGSYYFFFCLSGK